MFFLSKRLFSSQADKGSSNYKPPPPPLYFLIIYLNLYMDDPKEKLYTKK